MSGLELKYFVIKPRGTDAYAEASREALTAYARAIREENHDLYTDLMEWVGQAYREADNIPEPEE